MADASKFTDKAAELAGQAAAAAGPLAARAKELAEQGAASDDPARFLREQLQDPDLFAGELDLDAARPGAAVLGSDFERTEAESILVQLAGAQQVHRHDDGRDQGRPCRAQHQA